MPSEIEGLHLCQWTWRGTSGRPDDVFTNSFHFKASNFPVSDYDNVRDMLLDFYTGQYDAQDAPIYAYFTNDHMNGTWELNMYDLTESIPRVPVYSDTGFVEIPGGEGLQSQMAIVLSFQATRIAGLPQNRRRNRVYLGPFNLAATEGNEAAGALVQDMLFAGKGMAASSAGSFNWNWVVYSPFLDEQYTFHDGWVDNGWDVQRRRKLAASQRGVFTTELPT
jgi:hypothetical protein